MSSTYLNKIEKADIYVGCLIRPCKVTALSLSDINSSD